MLIKSERQLLYKTRHKPTFSFATQHGQQCSSRAALGPYRTCLESALALLSCPLLFLPWSNDIRSLAQCKGLFDRLPPLISSVCMCVCLNMAVCPVSLSDLMADREASQAPFRNTIEKKYPCNYIANKASLWKGNTKEYQWQIRQSEKTQGGGLAE